MTGYVFGGFFIIGHPGGVAVPQFLAAATFICAAKFISSALNWNLET